MAWSLGEWIFDASLRSFPCIFFDIFHFLVLFQSKARLRGKSSWHSPSTIHARRYVGIYIYIHMGIYTDLYIYTFIHIFIHRGRHLLLMGWYLLLLIECILLIDMVKNCSFSYNQILSQ